MNNKYIKPCPLCNGEAVIETTKAVYVDYFIQCTKCKLQTRRFTFKEKLIEYWNRRGA